MSIEEDRKRLSHRRNLENLRKLPRLTEMITAYLSDEKTDCHGHYIRSALIPSDQIEKVLSHSDLNLEGCKGVPSGVVHSTGNEEQHEYLRYGSLIGVEPLIIERNFYDIRPNYREISEEFRHFHNLYHKKKKDLSEYIKIEDDGNEYPVAIAEPHRIQIRLKEILQFAAIKEMHLAIYFDYREFSGYSEEELGLNINGGVDNLMQEELMCWEQYYTGPTFSLSGIELSVRRLIGKHLVKPLPKSKSGFWPFAGESKEEYVEFIISVDENGDDITYTSNPDELKTPADPRNVRGVDLDAPSYLTPVHFRKQVLDKYIQAPSKYDIEDSIVRCGRLWCMFIDNDHEDRVCAWLGDLGRDMPYSEQQHWRVHNIPPAGGISETYLQRQIFAQFTNSNQPEHIFKQRYRDLQKACEKHLGWQLVKPLGPGDEHIFKRLRVPVSDEESHFKDSVLDLSNILIERLNVKHLKALIPSDEQKDSTRGITLLEHVLTSRGFDDNEKHIHFLRSLWDLRTKRSSAHPEMHGSKNYERASEFFDLENLNRQEAFAKILKQASNTLAYFIEIVHSSKFNTK